MKINKKSKIFIFILCVMLLIMVIYKIVNTYALFYSEVNGKVEFKNGTWQIFVNGTDIAQGTDVKFLIDNIEIEEKNHVKQGNIAPGMYGKFNIEINPTDTDVSVRYDITLNKEEIENSFFDVKFSDNNSLIRTGKDTYTGIISLEDIRNGVKDNISLEVTWENNEENNEEDTKFASEYTSKIQIPITVHAIQYLGEEIIPYQE